MLFVCTMVAPAKREIHARETGIASQPSHFEALHPHGTIEAVQIPLADPNGTFPDRDERLSKPKWIFEGFSEAALTKFLERCYLEKNEIALVFDKRIWTVSSNGCIINPSDELLWGLNPVGRQQIYAALARDSRN